MSDEDWQRIRRDLSLSEREAEVVQLIFEGKKLLAIAQELKISVGTVKTYCQRVYHKLDVADRRELILTVLASDWQNNGRHGQNGQQNGHNGQQNGQNGQNGEP